MIFGDKAVFAIESEITEFLEGKPFGRFLLWCNHHLIGDDEDNWVMIYACRNHLVEFITYSRLMPEVDGMTKEIVFERVYEPVYSEGFFRSSYEEWSRIGGDLRTGGDLCACHHVEHLGMSSLMDRFQILLVESSNKEQRLIWRVVSSQEMYEGILPPQTFETVAQQFIDWLDSEWEKYRAGLKTDTGHSSR
jgi:hypothetical protein